VNIVLNRRREEDSSLDSDDTIELHLSGNRLAAIPGYPPSKCFPVVLFGFFVSL
jgi:hypothetical protein